MTYRLRISRMKIQISQNPQVTMTIRQSNKNRMHPYGFLSTYTIIAPPV
jgi:hypothetical protein